MISIFEFGNAIGERRCHHAATGRAVFTTDDRPGPWFNLITAGNTSKIYMVSVISTTEFFLYDIT